MKLARIAETLSPSQIVGEAQVEIEDLAYDTRTVGPGALFFCVPGTRFDGHELAERAIEAGAAALVVEHPVASRVPQVVVADARVAMAAAAAAFFGRPTEKLEVVGVTGTNGKTTTAFLLHSILSAAGRKPGLLGTIESRVGGERRPSIRTTPEAIDLQRLFREMLDAGDRSCAMEATSHGSELKRLERIRFAALVFTNLTQDHLDLHGTMDNYFEAKRRLFLEGRPPAAINIGYAWGRRLAGDRPDALTYGFAEDALLRPEALDDVELKLRGRFNVENALGAMAGARLLGIDDETIVRGLEALEGVPGRFETVDEGQPFTVVVDYAHTPDSLENVLVTARELDSARVICVFGCGGDRDREKRPVMGEIADTRFVIARAGAAPEEVSLADFWKLRAARTRGRSSPRSSPGPGTSSRSCPTGARRSPVRSSRLLPVTSSSSPGRGTSRASSSATEQSHLTTVKLHGKP